MDNVGLDTHTIQSPLRGSGFATQDCETSEGVVATPWSRGTTWEREDTMRANYPFLFEDESAMFSHLII